MGLSPYGDAWRRHRRIFHNLLNAGAIKKYHHIQTRSNTAFLRALLDTPEDFWFHIRR